MCSENGVEMDEPMTLDPADAEAIARSKHIVHILIEERAQKLMRSPFWPLYRSILYPLLREREARRMADAIAPLSGVRAMDYVSRALALDVRTRGGEHIPKDKRVLIAAVHPTGIADGVAMYDALKPLRDDIVFFANRDAIRIAKGFGDVVIPVEWVEGKRTRQRSRETLAVAREAFSNERCVVLFPSGRLAFMDENNALTEQEWLNSVTIFARKYDCPVIPAHITARNSRLYYFFWKLNPELRDITLFNELLNKRGKRFDIVFGPAIQPHDLEGEPAAVAAALREHALHDVTAGRPFVPLASRL